MGNNASTPARTPIRSSRNFDTGNSRKKSLNTKSSGSAYNLSPPWSNGDNNSRDRRSQSQSHIKSSQRNFLLTSNVPSPTTTATNTTPTRNNELVNNISHTQQNSPPFQQSDTPPFLPPTTNELTTNQFGSPPSRSLLYQEQTLSNGTSNINNRPHHQDQPMQPPNSPPPPRSILQYQEPPLNLSDSPLSRSTYERQKLTEDADLLRQQQLAQQVAAAEHARRVEAVRISALARRNALEAKSKEQLRRYYPYSEYII